MSAPALGPGVRVFIGYAPTTQCSGIGARARCTVGTIVEGPLPPGAHILWPSGKVEQITVPYWRVKPEGLPSVLVAEYLLTPIDDDDQVSEPDELELEVPA